MMARKGFWTVVDDSPVHVQGDPEKVSQEWLEKLVRAVRKELGEKQQGEARAGKGSCDD